MTRTLSLLAFAAGGPAAQAFVLIDDFTQGGIEVQLRNTERFTHEDFNLDRSHAAFGYRSYGTGINSNPNGATLTVSLGNGRHRHSSDLPVTWDSNMIFGDGASVEVDFSDETEFRVDLTTEEPSGAFADDWTLIVRDAHGVDAGNGGWLLRPEGIYFRKQAFTRQIDWSRVTLIQFTQDWNNPPNPLAYQVTRFYTVPDPCSALVLLTGLAFLCRARRRGTGTPGQ
jgi:hypothetical protein